ncbi:T9SS type A sorting domain-containing protein [bacterium]|nr:T9SS type A sorting domain-containing protein [bacterium]
MDIAAIAGPGWGLDVDYPYIAIHGSVGLWFMEYDSTIQLIEMKSAIQIPYSGIKTKFHPTQPFVYHQDIEDNLYTVNLIDIDDPVIVNTYVDIDGFDINGEYLYTFSEGTLYTYLNEDPMDPSLVSSAFISTLGNEIIVENDFLHGYGRYPEYTSYGFYDISDPSNPTLLSSYQSDFQHLLSAAGGHVLIGDGNNLTMLTVSQNPPYNIVSSSYDDMSSPGLCLEDGRVFGSEDIFGSPDEGISELIGNTWVTTGVGKSYDFTITSQGLFSLNYYEYSTDIWDINLYPVTLLSSYVYLGDEVTSVIHRDSLVFTSGGSTGTAMVYNFSNPMNVQLSSFLELLDHTGSLCSWQNYLYVLCIDYSVENNSLAVIDISDPSNIHLTGVEYVELPIDYYLGRIVAHDGYLYISGEDHLFSYSLLDPENPVLTATHVDDRQFTELIVLNGSLFANSYQLVKVFQTGPDLIFLSSFNPAYTSHFMAGFSDTLIVGGDSGFEVYTISNPLSPELLLEVDLPSSNSDIWNGAFDGHYLYADIYNYPTYSQKGLSVFDISPGISNVEMVDFHPTTENIGGQIDYQDSIIFFAQSSCLGIYYFGEEWVGVEEKPPSASPPIPQQLSLSIHPNPTNGDLRWQFDLPQAGHVDLAIYNLQGAKVGEHSAGYYNPGSHTLSWFPDHLSSGIYLAQVKAGEGVIQQKLVYLK